MPQYQKIKEDILYLSVSALLFFFRWQCATHGGEGKGQAERHRYGMKGEKVE